MFDHIAAYYEYIAERCQYLYPHARRVAIARCALYLDLGA